MEEIILDRVKISLGITSSDVLKDEMLKEMIRVNTDSVLCKIEPPDRLVEKVKKKFESCIVELTKYDYAKIGGEYQASHSENGVSRTWNSKEEIYNFYKVNESGYVKIIG